MAQPTAALLWAACRPQPIVSDVTGAVADGADVAAAARLAVAKRVSPLLWRALREAALVDEQAPWAEELKRDATRCHVQSRLVLPRVVASSFVPLVKAGLQPLAIKGVAIADRYPDPALRPMDDIDLVVPPDQVDAAEAVLLAHGWTRHDSDQDAHELHFLNHDSPGLHIDLHRSMGTWRSRSNRLTTTDLWRARVRTTLFETDAWVLPPELELVAHVAHAGKPYHAYDRLIWVVDVAVMAERQLDWDAVGQLASDLACRTTLAVGLRLAQYLGVQSPDELRQVPDARAQALAPLLSPDFPLLTYSGELRNRLRYALVDARSTRARLAAAQILAEGPLGAPRRSARFIKKNARRVRELLS